MNHTHNRNQYAPTPERTVEQIRHDDLVRAYNNANHSATNEVNNPAPLTVVETPAVPYPISSSDSEAESRRLVEAAFAPQTSVEPVQQVEQPQVAQILQFQPRPTAPNTLPIGELQEGA